MLQLHSALLNQPVLSLRTGAQVATTTALIVNPNNLKVEGFYCEDRFERRLPILLTQNIRDILSRGIAINDYEDLSDPEDLIRLQEVLELQFELAGKPVTTVSRQKVGKVVDFAVDDQSFFIKKLYVSRSLLKSLQTGQLSIDRDQIVEITNKKIIIKELMKPAKGQIHTTPQTA